MSHIGVRKGAWTEVEDILLKECIEKYGAGKWHKVPARSGLNRCRKSCRLRWLNYLQPDIKRGPFEEDEADLIRRLHQLLGNRWSLIAGRLPGRTANDIKNYWNTHLRKTWQPKASANCGSSHKAHDLGTNTTPNKVEILKPRPWKFSKISIASHSQQNELSVQYSFKYDKGNDGSENSPIKEMHPSSCSSELHEDDLPTSSWWERLLQDEAAILSEETASGSVEVRQKDEEVPPPAAAKESGEEGGVLSLHHHEFDIELFWDLLAKT
uniref:Uncharacterized protein n=1 Tax=Kalanchoe fedtschenkoi TaxID=63787 RepID=A0A7N0T069_KALFE